MSNDYISALELTGLLDKGSSQRVINQDTSRTSSYSFFLIPMFLISLTLFISFLIMRKKQRAFETGLRPEKTKDALKNNQEKPEKKVTFNEVQGIDELKPDLSRLVDIPKNLINIKFRGSSN